MRPLTPRVWAEYYRELRPYVEEEFPEVPRERIEPHQDDWSGVVAEIQRHTQLSAELIEQRLRKLDVDVLGIGIGEGEEDESGAGLAQLRLGQGFHDRDKPMIEDRLGKLNRRLKRFPADATELELTVKDRASTTQKVTLECWLPHFAKLVATSHEHDVRDALNEVCNDMWRQIDEAIDRRKEGVR